MNEHSSARVGRLPWTWLVAAAAGGIPVGLVWWLLAPGGLNLISGNPALGDATNPAVWLPRDLTLGALLLFAGCLMAVLISDNGGRAAQAAFLLSLGGGLLGALIAWQTGVLAGRLWGAPADTAVNASFAFSLRSVSVLLLWPAATAACVFVLSLLTLLKQGADGGKAPLADGAAPGA